MDFDRLSDNRAIAEEAKRSRVSSGFIMVDSRSKIHRLIDLYNVPPQAYNLDSLLTIVQENDKPLWNFSNLVGQL